MSAACRACLGLGCASAVSALRDASATIMHVQGALRNADFCTDFVPSLALPHVPLLVGAELLVSAGEGERAVGKPVCEGGWAWQHTVAAGDFARDPCIDLPVVLFHSLFASVPECSLLHIVYKKEPDECRACKLVTLWLRHEEGQGHRRQAAPAGSGRQRQLGPRPRRDG